jgi:RimJ/RimL family protein N-acetyltransferase
MLEGTHVGLRAIEPADLPTLLEFRNRPHFRRFFREYRELSPSHQQKWYDTVVMGDANTRMFSIVELGTGRLLGACGLCYIDPINRTADFSIYIGADDLYIDDKFAPDAARVMIRYGYDELNLHRLWSEIYAIDEAKQAFFTKLGFHLDGRHRETHWTEGGWVDSLYYSLLSTDPRV